MILIQHVAQTSRSLRRAACSLFGLLVLGVVPAAAKDYIVFSSGLAQPLGDTDSFAAAGSNFEVRWRHYNRGHTAYEFLVGYSQSGVGEEDGEIKKTMRFFEALVREKNELAQLQGGPGFGFTLAEFGALELFYLDLNVLYRVMQRSRFSPVLSVGGGVYNWRLPFRIKFFDVPSFGEQHAYDAIDQARQYQFLFNDDLPEQVIDFTKHETSGGLNAAFGIDLRMSRNWSIGLDARAHFVFSSGDGDPEDGVDDQEYLDSMTFLYFNGGLSYRF